MAEISKASKIRIYLLSVLLVGVVYAAKYVLIPAGGAETVMGISHDLACPCECPMVLEDCHMSCGLSWKDSIGMKLKAGLGRDEITAYFYKRYGDEALLNPVQRLYGKWYQFTRGGFPLVDSLLVVGLVLIWGGVVYYVIIWLKGMRRHD
ncbi:MAG: cytochrome c-type biogenesis protein CcmH [Nitrospirota bacterium]|nr:cytochrome c-type biogenesis protein CcmH [Nitrospirota bacterium]